MIRKLLVVGALAALAATPARRTNADDTVRDVAGVDSATLARLEEIARDYAKAGHVDENLRLAPWACGTGPMIDEPRVSKDHDRKKVYYLYAKDKDAYKKYATVEGQWVVKESFALPGDETETVGKKAGLYIMLRARARVSCRSGPVDPWVFAIATPEGAITRAGRIASCVACHEHGNNEDLFGLDGKKKENP